MPSIPSRSLKPKQLLPKGQETVDMTSASWAAKCLKSLFTKKYMGKLHFNFISKGQSINRKCIVSPSRRSLHESCCCAGTATSSADALEDLKKIDVAISGQQLEYTIQKNQLTAQSLQQGLDSKSQPEVIQATKKSKVPLIRVFYHTCPTEGLSMELIV